MRLLDKVAQSAGPIIVQSLTDGRIWSLPGADVLADEVRRCPLRYVLHDDVTEICTQLAFESDSILGSSMALLRVPAPCLWLEFAGGARKKVFADSHNADSGPDLSLKQRVGLLVKCDERGRKGSIDISWDGATGDELDVAPFTIEFDFDDDSFAHRGHTTADGIRVDVNVGDHPELRALYNCVRFKLRPEWDRYYRSSARSEICFHQALQADLTPLLVDVPFLAMFCLLLVSKGAMYRQLCDRSGINRPRLRKGRPALLDHVELTMNLGELERTSHEAGMSRSVPRLHFVRGHLVRRNDTIFWRTSHMRGKPEIGSIRARTVSLRMTAAAG